jgi:hypothetical protein
MSWVGNLCWSDEKGPEIRAFFLLIDKPAQ